MWNNIGNHPIVSSTGDGYVKIKFKCRECGKDIVTDSINIPEPNQMADNAEESNVYLAHEEICDDNNCGEEHELNISNGNGGMYVNIDGVSEGDIFYTSTK